MIPSRAGKIMIQQGHPIQVLMAFQQTPGGNGITSYHHLAFCLEDFTDCVMLDCAMSLGVQ